MDDAGSSGGSGGFRPGVDNLDEPPNSRIFLVISKYTSELVLRERFSPFGDIQDIWVVRDKHTKESKGVAFVKFARSSQACRAMEEMHGQCLGPNDTKPIKVRDWGAWVSVCEVEIPRLGCLGYGCPGLRVPARGRRCGLGALPPLCCTGDACCASGASGMAWRNGSPPSGQRSLFLWEQIG